MEFRIQSKALLILAFVDTTLWWLAPTCSLGKKSASWSFPLPHPELPVGPPIAPSKM